MSNRQSKTELIPRQQYANRWVIARHKDGFAPSDFAYIFTAPGISEEDIEMYAKQFANSSALTRELEEKVETLREALKIGLHYTKVAQINHRPAVPDIFNNYDKEIRLIEEALRSTFTPETKTGEI